MKIFNIENRNYSGGQTILKLQRSDGKIFVLPAAEALLKKMAGRFNKSEDELVELALRMMTGKDVSPALWDPPR